MIRSLLLSTSFLLLAGCGSVTNSDSGSNSGSGGDTTPPVITLNGSQTIEILMGRPYTEEGASAIDDVDGSVNVTLSGEVNTDVVGTYSIIYTASDSSQNAADKIRNVIVVSEHAQSLKTTIDVLALYTTDAADLYHGDISTRLSHGIALANTVNRNSFVDVTLRLVHSEEYPFSQEPSGEDILIEAKNNLTIEGLRQSYSADNVLIYRPYKNDGVCGIAYVNRSLNPAESIAHISIDCPSETVPHEVGHLYGLAHSHKQEGTGIHSYSYGHGEEHKFATIMSYVETFDVSSYELVYSNPNLVCKGSPCGIAEGYSNAADASRTIKEVKGSIASFF